MKFTDRGIQSLKATGKRYEKSETNGHGLRIRVGRTGTRTFVYVYRRYGKLHRLTIGEYPGTTLEMAHKLHSAARCAVRDGLDPKDLLPHYSNRTGVDGHTVAELADEWLDRYVRDHRKNWIEVERVLGKDVLPPWGDRKAATISRREVVELLDGIVDRGAPIQANRTYQMVQQMFEFGVRRAILETSPCVALDKPGGREPSRDRTLTDDEVKTFWVTLDQCEMTAALRTALRLLLVTAQRRGELANARWDAIDLDAKSWQIPAEDAKNGRAHTVPLSDLAISLLKELDSLVTAKAQNKDKEKSEFILPSPTVKGFPIRAEAITRALTRNRPKFKISSFGVHDLRRTAASHMTALGVPRLHVAKVLNHAESGVTAIYDRHDYAQEKREALQLWADHLQAIVQGRRKKVTPIRAAG